MESLHLCCENGLVKDAKKLLDNGSNINELNDEGFTPLMVAIQNQQIKIVNLLLKRIDLNILIENDNGLSAMTICRNNILKKPVSDFYHYINDNKEIVKTENPLLKYHEITQELSNRWRILPAEEKNNYKLKSKEDVKRFKNYGQIAKLLAEYCVKYNILNI